MPRLIASGLAREISVVVFDKDGTLIDFDKAWAGRLKRAISAVRDTAGCDGAVEEALYRTLGAEPSSGAMLLDGPYVSASIADTCTIAAAVLYQSGLSWQRSQEIIAGAMRPIFVAAPLPHELAGIGDVAEFLGRMKSSGLRLAVATNDERSGTLACLDTLGVTQLFEAIVCADDAGIAPKPAPDGILHIARSLGARPEHVAMIGDSASDMCAGRSAGAGMIIGVTSGPATADQLRPLADVVVADIHAVAVVD